MAYCFKEIISRHSMLEFEERKPKDICVKVLGEGCFDFSVEWLVL